MRAVVFATDREGRDVSSRRSGRGALRGRGGPQRKAGVRFSRNAGGDVAAGAAYCESRVRAHRSKASKEWGGSMFASTSSDVAPPAVRNPRMWQQSQRQAREIMHESAKSRGLAPPKIKRNTVL